jgi:mono/diheme cytochrome c family protein
MNKSTTKIKIVFALSIQISLMTSNAAEVEEVLAVAERGEAIFQREASCKTCHGENGEGLIGPSIQYGPTPFDIHYQLNTNPQMAPVRELLNPSNDDLIAVSVYIRRMTGTPPADIDLQGLRATLNSIQDYPAVPDYFLTDRDKSIQAIESFDSVLADWKRRSKPGNIKHTYEVREVADFEPGEPKFRPEPGGLYFY